MAKKGITNTLVWVLMALLILGLGGFGVTNLSGTVRSIGSVGDSDIDVDEYARALQREIRAVEAERGEPVSFAEARDIGVTDSVLARLIASAAFDHETGQIGLSIGDENLRDEIVGMQQFQGVDGSFDREGYRYALDQAGLSESAFEEDIRAETARSFLQAAVMAGVTMPEGYMQTLLDYLGEQRSVTWSVLGRDDLQTGMPVPDDSDLQTYHSENEDQFTVPERKRITYALLTPDMLIDTIEVDEEALRDAYEARESEFNQPERRLVERLAFGSEEAAQAALEQIESGDSTFEDLVAERGLDLADIDLGDVSRADLEGAGDDVFAASTGDVVGPLSSPVGPALFRVNAVLSEQVTTFEEAEPDLRAELAADRARRVVDSRIDAVDDLLAGGATIEDLADETDLELGQIDWHEGISEGIAAYDAFRSAASAVSEGDYPEVMQLDEGGIFAMRLDEVVPPEVQPLEEVRDAVTAAWEQEALVSELKAQAEPVVERLAGGESLEEAGLSVDGSQTLTRRGFRAEVPPSFIETVFGMEEGGATMIEGDGRVFVIKLDEILPPDSEDSDLQELQDLLQQRAATSLSQDLFQVLANDIRNRAGIELDQAAMNAVHSNFQ
ncbi:peptidyl-prolyl cis-trans isomerase [Roseovarius indicus]|uniref:Parvulin-like PPIase n=1 Tax=Roseovarius indicus TaxID=540747 RepID=A0A0T5P8C0_9RHOB|nr:peptidyl-prolyl cis-trans isomerase [Roseovarius indicus]KRS17483.1 peptidylprolyl isomerase [Roseovarius indicus]QEW26674.1 Peptidyl-prolyl cis-trans isomerase D [Roseovarius indicus]SFD61833.1 peptidyl-prolyl cis-trans isomerase D [Roseovarius indicus]